MIYDAFLFFNELDLLEIRLNELDSAVDRFVIVECTKTFSSIEKPLYFKENKERYSKFLDKIIHVVVDDTPTDLPSLRGKPHNRHEIERWQRSQIDRGLKDCKPDDVVVVSDVDEIYRPKDICEAINLLDVGQDIVGMKQKFYYYYLNGLCTENGSMSSWWGPATCYYKNFKGAQHLRDNRGKNNHKYVNWAGWHFSYLGGPEAIAKKIEAYAHKEWDNDVIKNKERLADRIDRGLDIFDRQGRPRQLYVEIDDSFPKYLLDNIDKFKHLIKKS